MLLSTQTSCFRKRFNDAESIRIIKNAGFDAFDMSLFDVGADITSRFNTDSYREYAKDLKKLADDIGIVCNQSHAPYPSSVGVPEKDEAIFESIVRAMEIASIMGAGIIIVHPKQHLEYSEHIDELKEMNLEFYSRLIPYCEKFNIKVATENMWRYAPGSRHIIDSTASRAAEFCEYVDMLNSKYIVACLDIGHVPLVGENLKNIIHALGSRLQALHVHDNEFVTDMHTLPFMSKINFENVTTALADIGYSGDFTFEADGFYLNIPEGLIPQAARFMCETGRYLIERINSKI